MISIIVPVYNSENYIERCIESILSQTYADWELIVVNDGSTDDSEKIIKHLVALDSRIRYYYKNNGGVSSARNLGIKNAKGEFILFLDSDDWLSYNTCEVLIRNIKQTNADCVVFGLTQSHGNIWAPIMYRRYDSLKDLKNEFDYWLNTELLSSSVNKLYKKSLLKKGFNEEISFGEDLIFSLDYISNCEKILFIEAPLYQHEVYNASSITHSFFLNRLNEIEYIQNKVLEFADDINIETYRKYYSDIIRYVKMLLRQRTLSMDEKSKIARNWLHNSFYKELSLYSYKTNLMDFIYAKLVQLGCWRLLCLLHNIKNHVSL